MARNPPDKPGDTNREERLAAKLRENLHRRKAQARAQGGSGHEAAGDGPSQTPPEQLGRGAPDEGA